MTTHVDYSYRYPCDRSPQFPLLPSAQFKQANQISVTGVSGQYDTLSTEVDFANKRDNESGVRLKQYLPIERDLHPILPGRRQRFEVPLPSPDQAYSLSDFHRYRRLKDYQPNQVARVDNVLAYKYCPTCCALHAGGCIGCQRDANYALQLSTDRMPWRHPRPNAPFGRGFYGYLHEKLDNHRTGLFRSSKYH